MFSTLGMSLPVSLGNCVTIRPTVLEGSHDESDGGLSYVNHVKIVEAGAALLRGTKPRLLGLNLGVLIHGSAVSVLFK